ncbi:hypothetical protein FRC09_005505, partial [Ceratobasidium sp. 395]
DQLNLVWAQYLTRVPILEPGSSVVHTPPRSLRARVRRDNDASSPGFEPKPSRCQTARGIISIRSLHPSSPLPLVPLVASFGQCQKTQVNRHRHIDCVSGAS